MTDFIKSSNICQRWDAGLNSHESVRLRSNLWNPLNSNSAYTWQTLPKESKTH